MRQGVGGVVDHNVDPTESRNGLAYEVGQGIQIAYVSRHRQSGTAGGLDLPDCLLASFSLAAGHHDLCTHGRKTVDDGPADPAAPPGDNDHSIGEIELVEQGISVHRFLQEMTR